MFKSLFGKKPAFDDAKKAELAEIIAGYLQIQMMTATEMMAGKATIEDTNGGPKRKAIGYVYGFIDAALRVRKQDMSDLTVGVPVTFQVLRKLWADRANAYMEFLTKNIGSDQLMMLGVLRGGQEYVEFKNSSGKKAPTGFTAFLMEGETDTSHSDTSSPPKVSTAQKIVADPFRDAMAAHDSGDYITALQILRPLADQGNAEAQNNLGGMYTKGQGLPQNYAEALKWYRLAADGGFALAQYNLGGMYAAGRGVPQSDDEAVKWYRLAADQGNAEAQFNLGKMYADGRGVPQNYAEALTWYRLAADQGDANAQFNLGNLYLNGRGVPQNDVEAVKWYRRAADQGVASAQLNLGVMCLRGQGTPKNEVRGLMWLILAAQQSNPKATQGRDIVAKDMTQAQVAEAQKLAQDWKPTSA